MLLGMKKDDIGNRMKSYYENRTKTFLPRRTYTIIRIDGKAFHSYTRGLVKPFDDKLMSDMNDTAKYLCSNIQGAKLAFVQSDEISILLTDFDTFTTDAWFDGNVQKMVSVSASLATAKFNQLRPDKIALFDSRVFTVPTSAEVANFFIWRQQDTVRNSISSLAQSLYSAKELHGKNTSQMQDMCIAKGQNWNNLPVMCKRGRLIIKIVYTDINRSYWELAEPPVFTKDFIIHDMIPQIP